MHYLIKLFNESTPLAISTIKGEFVTTPLAISTLKGEFATTPLAISNVKGEYVRSCKKSLLFLLYCIYGKGVYASCTEYLY